MKTNVSTNENKTRSRRGRPPKAGKTTIINGGNFSNCFNEITVETPLEKLNKWDLRDLYKNNEGVRIRAKKEYQKEFLRNIENHLYRTINEIIKNVEADIENQELQEDGSKALNPSEYSKAAESGDVEVDKYIDLLTPFTAMNIETALKTIKDKAFLNYFTNNATTLFDSSKFVVDNNYNLYEKIHKLFA